jgi:trimeric autotransporter adhesin
MSDDPRFERIARDWLEVGPAQAPDHAIQAVLLALPSTPQDRGQRVPLRRFPNMSAFIRVAVVAAAAMAIVSVPLGVGPNPRSATVAATVLPPSACATGTSLAGGTIATVAGNGTAASTKVDTPALMAGLDPIAVAVAPDGSLAISGGTSNSVWRLAADGALTHLVDPASSAGIGAPTGLAFEPSGDLFIADWGTSKIWQWSGGKLTSVAGTYERGSTGNDGPATEAQIEPSSLGIGPDGSIYFDDLNNYRRIDPQGVVHAFAGSTTPGFAGDGGPAVDAALGGYAGGVAVDHQGNVYLGDPGNHVIRKVDTSGIITTFAGTGVAGYSGDGGAATAAQLGWPTSVAVDSTGNVYLTDAGSNTVRRIDPAGIITTVAGTGTGGFSGDCGPAVGAQLSGPTSVAVGDGVLYIVDGQNHRARMIVM